MAIFRGIGGAGDSTTDATVTAVTTQAVNAANSATSAASSASSASSASTSAANSASNAASSASSAATSASSATANAAAAASSATAAAASQVAAAASETAAGASETAVATSASNAATSASSASTSASTATTQATNATLSATTATTKASEASTSASGAATSAANAATSETNAATSETNAASSASAASTSASNAAASETNAASSASTASTAATNAATSASNAATSETNAASSASSASTSASNAATSEANAATSATTATTQATNAATSATNAATSASAAASSASAASASADAALTALDNFDDRYLGQKASDPALDNDGNALIAGALYFNTTDSVMKVYDGSIWVAAYASLSGALLAANNLSDVASVSASRTNLGLGTAATTASTDYATAAQGATADTAVQPNTSPTLSGATFTSGTANGVTYLNGSKVLTSGSALTFDGQNVGVDAASAYGTSYITLSLRSRFGFDGNNVVVSDNGTAKDITFLTSGSERMRLTSTGLGIGTSSPIGKFHVASGAGLNSYFNSTAAGIYLQIANNGTNLGYIGDGGSLVSGGSNTDFAIRSQAALKFSVNGNATAATIDSAGNLGLGVTPSAWGGGKKVLQASNASFAGQSDRFEIWGNGYYDGSAVKYISDGYATLYQSVNGAHSWQTATSGTAGAAISLTQAMTLDASGRQLIGLTSSQSNDARLQVKRTDATNGALTYSIGWLQNATGYEDGLNVLATDQAVTLAADYAGTNHGTSLIFATNGGASAFGATERARIDSSGNVGIGTSSPGSYAFNDPAKMVVANTSGNSTLSIVSGSSSIGYLAFADGTSGTSRYAGSIQYNHSANYMSMHTTDGTERLRIDSSGNLGLGTTSLTAISGYTAFKINNASSGAILDLAQGDTMRGRLVGVASALTIETNTGIPILFAPAGTERLRINSSGNVGIGTTSPTQKLDVNGTVKATAFVGDGSGLTGIAGGVTSLNGQTGAITNTSLYAIGSYVPAYSIVGNTAYTEGSTIAGGSLGRAADSKRMGSNYNGNSSAAACFMQSTDGYVLLGATGTWRSMSRSNPADLPSYGTYYFTNLWVRIS